MEEAGAPGSLSSVENRDMDAVSTAERSNKQASEGPSNQSEGSISGSSSTNQSDKDILRRVLQTHKASLKRRFENISEGINKAGAETLLKNVYTELYIIEGESEGVNKEHEVWQIESASRVQATDDTPINCNDIFKPLPGRDDSIRTVMTKGVAGIGKTVSVQKFIIDWTDGLANQDVDFIFPLPFRELNLIKNDQYSLHRLLLDFHPELRELKHGDDYKDCQVLVIFDGLDEIRSPLNFKGNPKLSDLNQTTSVDVLITSLIQGCLLPSALIWITSRPAVAGQIPPQCISLMTEVRGFTNPQKDEYFRKRIKDESLSEQIISHIKASRSVHIMCHIPVFCWIAAIVLQQMLKKGKNKYVPKTLTEMFIHFLLIQTTRMDQKYHGGSKTSQKALLEVQRGIIMKLAELAFRHLEIGNVMFYEEDLRECGIDVQEASVYSGLCTEIFKEESVFHQRKVYSFVHLSIQEFLAAVYVFNTYASGYLESLGSLLGEEDNLHVLLKSAVNKALKSQNGHLDLFIRFLVGISLQGNQRLLKGLLQQVHTTNSMREVGRYIKNLNREDLSPDRCINLFHCLFEMDDQSMHKEIQKYMSSPENSKQRQLSPAHCSALAHMLLMSEEVLDEFDLKSYSTSDEGRRRLLPAVRCFKNARLANCRFTDQSCDILASVLQSPNSLTAMDLHESTLGDSGVQLLSRGLSSPQCRLKKLGLADCNLSGESCKTIATVLQSPTALEDLDMSANVLGDIGILNLCKGLSNLQCRLKTLRLCKCHISDEGFVCLVLTLMLNPSCVEELYVSNNHPTGSAEKLLSATLKNPSHKVKVLRLAGLNLTSASCELLASVLQSPNSLKDINLSHNTVGDSGVHLLSKGLRSPHCRLLSLRSVVSILLPSVMCENNPL
ncbi:NACHT, LRR and PYD domains-containing protein 3-like [Engraulis encrasicolus]|uniref:NACHT, LRR and PYD domains-containing protein 3-like n=1 Tax=Engraulis encrasicolus TaxID=184585 RepID=UPI002FD02F59